MLTANKDFPVLIIGGGAAGLSTSAALSREGIRAIILERDDHIGGTWKRRYDCLHLHTIRRYSGLAYLPISKSLPRYLSKDEYAEYLKEYADALGLDISLGERVQSIKEISNSDKEKRWEILTNRGKRVARCIVVATGNHAQAFIPRLRGIDKFSGVVLHSSEYTNGTEYSGKKVLVIGLGNSGAEISADLAKHGARSVTVSMRTTPPIVTREMFKVLPVQLFGILLMNIGMPRVIDRVGTALRRISIGDLRPFGIGPAEWGPFTARKPAVIDVGFVDQLKNSRITVRPEIKSFDSTGVIYVDGSRDEVDAVITATGFRTGLEKIIAVPGALNEFGQPQLDSGSPESALGLYFIGFNETVRGQLFEINRDSKLLAREVERFLLR